MSIKPEDIKYLIKPQKITDNVYFVGTFDWSSSSHLIDTGDGLILIDSGFPYAMDKVFENIENFGFDLSQIKYLLISHGHYDHMGSSAILREKYGTKLFLGEQDRLYANGELDLTWAKELGFEYTLPFEPDVLIKDGDEITLGNTTIKCYNTPGHTPGTMSFVFNSTYAGKEYVCATFGGAGINTMEKCFLEKYSLPFNCREDFRNSLHRMSKIKVDIHLGNHPFNSGTKEKIKKWEDDPNISNPFIDSDEWQRFLKYCEKTLDDMLEKEDKMENKQYSQLEKNTVDSRNQLKESGVVKFFNLEANGLKVMFVGNSITLHGILPSIGWHGEWGMAASKKENDYVHILMKKILEKQENSSFCICQVASWESNYKEGKEKYPLYESARDFDADIIVMRFVENCAGKDFDKEIFKNEMSDLLCYLNPNNKAKFVMTTGFWHHPGDEVIAEFAKEKNYPIAFLGDLGDNDEMMAKGLFEHSGVAMHPGDLGMKTIADRIYEKLENYL